MAKTIICEGKTSNEAIEKGLKELGHKLEDVNVKVLEDGERKAFFSILDPRVVRVELTVKENVAKKYNIPQNNEEQKIVSDEDLKKCNENISVFLDDFSKAYDGIKFAIEEKDNGLIVVISGENASKLIGYKGETMNAIQNILSAIGNKNTEQRVRVSLDICDYREKREKLLKELACKLEKTVIRTGKKIVLEPMSAYERKILHSSLQGSSLVTTYSIGEEPHRRVVIDKK